MTLHEISIKMMRKNLGRYRIYFLCSLSAASLFYCFISIQTNSSFMNAEIVNPLISSSIYFPSVSAAVFLVLFLPASFRAFLASRKPEYGIMFSLGMSRKEAAWNMLFEHAVIAASALAAALAAGTVMSGLFFTVIRYAVGIRGLQWEFSLKPYKITVLLYAAVTLAAFVLNAAEFLRETIVSLQKSAYRAERSGVLYRTLRRVCPGYMNRHMAEWSFLRRHAKAWTLRYLAASFMTGSAILLAGVCLNMYPALLRDAKTYSPYDMVYSEIDGRNQVPEEKVAEILSKKGITVKQTVQMPYIRTASFNYLPQEEVNSRFECDYQIEEGTFLNVFQYDLQDGYEHSLQPVSEAEYGKNKKLYSAGSDVKILWNVNPAFADRTLIVCNADFEKLKKDAYSQTGLAHLYRFEQEERSFDEIYEAVCAVSSCLKAANKTEEPEYDVSSKAESCLDAVKSGQFLLLLISFIAALLLMAAFLLIYFRIQSEMDENSRAVKSLRLTGMTRLEILRCIKYKNFLRFLIPPVLGTGSSLLPLYCLNQAYKAGGKGMFTGIVLGIMIMTGEGLFCRWYSEKEIKLMQLFWGN